MENYVPASERPNPRTSLLSTVERAWALHAEAADELLRQVVVDYGGCDRPATCECSAARVIRLLGLDVHDSVPSEPTCVQGVLDAARKFVSRPVSGSEWRQEVTNDDYQRLHGAVLALDGGR